MDRAITTGDVVIAFGGAVILLFVVAGIFYVLAKIAEGFKH